MNPHEEDNTLVKSMALALVAAVALAQGPGFGPGSGEAGYGGGYVPPNPNLTAEQSSKIGSLAAGPLMRLGPSQRSGGETA